MKDYLIIGQGFAGTSISFRLTLANRSFLLIDQARPHTASRVASGLYNPVVLKRLKAVWNAAQQLEALEGFYEEMEEMTGSRFIIPDHIRRALHSEAETNDWNVGADSNSLEGFLKTPIDDNPHPHLKATHGLGEVLKTGRVDPDAMLDAWREYLGQNKLLHEGPFDHTALRITHDGYEYNGETYKKVIFAEGLQTMLKNPWFNYLPFSPTKGELLVIHAPELKVPYPIHSSHFIMPLGQDQYAVGATYSWDDLEETETEKAREELEAFLSKAIDCPYRIIGRRVGVRPNTRDRKPFLGEHPENKGMFIYNGLGSRGVLMAPYLSQCLLDRMEKNVELPPEMDISRFVSFYRNQADT